jgi:hypothetical protein
MYHNEQFHGCLGDASQLVDEPITKLEYMDLIIPNLLLAQDHLSHICGDY